MTNPVIEAMAEASYKRRKEIAWECGCIVPEWDCLGRGVKFTEIDCLTSALKALEENITDEMLAAATLAVREHDETAFIQDGWNNKTTKIDGGVDFSKAFTAMLRAAREE